MKRVPAAETLLDRPGGTVQHFRVAPDASAAKRRSNLLLRIGIATSAAAPATGRKGADR